VSFLIGLTSIVADGSTDFHKSKCGDLRIGRIASVEGVLQPNLTIKATRIETDK
jgi:hypothetical protein